MLELFCGSASISKAFSIQGFDTCTVDIRKRKGKCEPDIQADILQICAADLPRSFYDVIYAAVPCNAFSNAAGNYYRDGTGYKESTKYFNSVLRKTLKLIEEFSPTIYFIENPRASLRYNKLMIDFLARTSGTIKECTLGSYGFPTTKPTDIFTNCSALTLRQKMKFGRGAKVTGTNFNNLTTVQRQATPFELGAELAAQSMPVLISKNHPDFENSQNFGFEYYSAKKSTSLEAITATIAPRVISTHYGISETPRN